MGQKQRSAPRPSLILADDHRLVVEAIAARLGEHFDVTGIAFGGDDLLALLRRQTAECLLLDISMPGRNGIDLLPAIGRLRPALPVILVTMMCDRHLADMALGAGARGYVPKDAPLEELVAAIRTVLAGNTFVSNLVPKASHRVSLAARHPALHRLSPRQYEIVLLLGQGKCAAEISRELELSQSTMTYHKHHIMQALGVRADADLVRYAVLLAAEGEGNRAPCNA